MGLLGAPPFVLGGEETYRDFSTIPLDQFINPFSLALSHTKRLEPFQLLQVCQPCGRIAERHSQRLLETCLKLYSIVIVKIRVQLLLSFALFLTLFFEPSP